MLFDNISPASGAWIRHILVTLLVVMLVLFVEQLIVGSSFS